MKGNKMQSTEEKTTVYVLKTDFSGVPCPDRLGYTMNAVKVGGKFASATNGVIAAVAVNDAEDTAMIPRDALPAPKAKNRQVKHAGNTWTDAKGKPKAAALETDRPMPPIQDVLPEAEPGMVAVKFNAAQLLALAKAITPASEDAIITVMFNPEDKRATFPALAIGADEYGDTCGIGAIMTVKKRDCDADARLKYNTMRDAYRAVEKPTA